MAAGEAGGLPSGSPFALDDLAAYRRWREWKLDRAPRRVEDLLVAVDDMAAPTAAEIAALTSTLQRANMAVYASPAAQGREDKQLPMVLASRLGLRHLDANWLADEDGVSSITPAVANDGAPRPDFIPYTTQPIRWHTDGYYNPPERTIRAMILHCVRPASEGGANALLDHEIAYILLRDENPDWVRALSAPDAMTIPARGDADGEARPAQPGPVFSVDSESGDLHMRYTARTRSIVWKDDAATAAAVARLSSLLAGDARSSPHVFRLRQEGGMGLVCNNVLHDRSAFAEFDGSLPRLLYRARFHERIAATVGTWRMNFE